MLAQTLSSTSLILSRPMKYALYLPVVLWKALFKGAVLSEEQEFSSQIRPAKNIKIGVPLLRITK
jgi:hypothetical protein